MAANEESDPSAILNGFWVTLFCVNTISLICCSAQGSDGQYGCRKSRVVPQIAWAHSPATIERSKNQMR